MNEIQQKNLKDNAEPVKFERRDFIKIGAATLTISVVGGGLFKFLVSGREKSYKFQASMNKPNKNPAFSFKKKLDGSVIFVTRLPNGETLKYELNNIGTELYLGCDGQHNRDEIIRHAALKLGKDVNTFTLEAKQFLAELERQNLIVTTGKVNLFYQTVVRHENA